MEMPDRDTRTACHPDYFGNVDIWGFLVISFGIRISKRYAFDFGGLYVSRHIDDGLSVFNLDIDWDRYKSAHSPRFSFALRLLNLTLIEFSVYRTGENQ
jgi:hypothetical protein